MPPLPLEVPRTSRSWEGTVRHRLERLRRRVPRRSPYGGPLEVRGCGLGLPRNPRRRHPCLPHPPRGPRGLVHLARTGVGREVDPFPVLILPGGPSHRAGWNCGRGPRRARGRHSGGRERLRGHPRGPRHGRDLRGGGLAAERLGRPCPHRVPHRGVPEAAGVLAEGDVGGREGLPAREVAPTCARRGPFQTSGLGATHRDAAGGGAIARNALEPVGMSSKSRPRPDLPRRARPAPRS